MKMDRTRKKAFDARVIQRYHKRVFGGKTVSVPQAVEKLSERLGCDRSREAVLAHIAANKVTPRRPSPQPKPTPEPPVIGGDFYDTWAWKEARFAALKRHGRRCLCCGWSPGQSDGNYLVVDHIKPLRMYPQLALDPNNHQVLCNDCNKGKSYKHQDDFRPSVKDNA